MARIRICGNCGKQINADKEGYYDRQAQMWICHDCAQKIIENRKQRMIENAGRPDLSGKGVPSAGASGRAGVCEKWG